MNDYLAIEASGLAKSYRDVPVLARRPEHPARQRLRPTSGRTGGQDHDRAILATLTEGRRAGPGGRVRRAPRASAVRRRISLTGQFAALDEAQTGEETCA